MGMIWSGTNDEHYSLEVSTFFSFMQLDLAEVNVTDNVRSVMP
jgi:hypothetical protein